MRVFAGWKKRERERERQREREGEREGERERERKRERKRKRLMFSVFEQHLMLPLANWFAVYPGPGLRS